MNDAYAAMIIPLGGRDPGHPDTGLPPSPGHPSTGPMPDPGHPWLPGALGGGHIDNSLPIPPLPPELNPPPPQIWPPVAPVFPAGPDNALPPPGTIWPPLPAGMPAGELLVLIYITGIGWRWTVIDTSLTVDNTLPPSPEPK